MLSEKKSRLPFALNSLSGLTLQNHFIHLILRSFFAAAMLFCFAPTSGFARSEGLSHAASQQNTRQSLGALPMTFEPNRGQTDSDVRCIARCPGASLYFLDNAVEFFVTKPGASHPETVTMRITGGRPFPQIEAVGRLPGKINYFKGNDPTLWKTGIPTYRKVKYHSVYPGIDLVFYGNPTTLEYDFIVRPGADPSQIRLAFENAREDGPIENGILALVTQNGARMLQHKPFIYQEEESLRRPVEGAYKRLGSGLYGFEVPAYDVNRPLIIDPSLQFSSYLGGTDEEPRNNQGDIISAGTENVQGIVYGPDGGIYIGGETTASNFPIISQIPDAANDSSLTVEWDAWVAKLHPSGNFLEWSTIIGGLGEDSLNGLALDSAGDVVLTGRSSTVFPEVRPIFDDGPMYAAKISGDGSELLFSTRFGGSGSGYASDVAVDPGDNICITGKTSSEDFPATAVAYQPLLNTDDPQSTTDAFVARIDPDAGALTYATFFGGSGEEWGRGIAVDAAGSIYITGETSSTDLPLKDAWQDAFAGGAYDGFITRFDANPSFLEYSTYIGSNDEGSGAATERCMDIALDSTGRAYVTGITYSNDFPAVNAVQDTPGGGPDAFMAVLEADGSDLVFSTYLGGSEADYAYAIAVDPTGHAYVGGQTSSRNDSDTPFPLAYAVQTDFGLGATDYWDGFAAVFTPVDEQGSSLLFSTYLGGSSWDSVLCIDSGNAGDFFVGGQTTSSNFPVVGGIDFPGGAYPRQNELQGTYDAFVAKFGGGNAVSCDLELTSMENADPVKILENLIHVMTVANIGQEVAENAVLTGELSGVFDSVDLESSAGSCSGGASFTCDLRDIDPQSSVVVTMTAVPSRLGTCALEAYVYNDITESDTDNNFLSEDTEIIPASDLIPDPTYAVFPTTEAGGASIAQTFLITNNAAVDRTVGALNLSGKNDREFVMENDSCSGQTLAPGGQCTVDVYMAPASSGAKEALLNLPSDDPAFPVVEVPLSGEGYILGLPTVLLRRTGQTTSYATGDDGDLQMGVAWPDPRFVDNEDGTITDLLTGLMWLKHSTCSAAIGIGSSYYGELTWQEALDFVAGINDGTYDISACGAYSADYTDWRLPNANEMKSLHCAEPTTSGADLLTSWGFIHWYSPTGGEQKWWTSTTYVYEWSTAAYYSSVRLEPIKTAGKTPNPSYLKSGIQAWPVRDSGIPALSTMARTGLTQCYNAVNTEIDCLGTGQDGEWETGVAPPSPRFIDHGDGRVTDLMTHLVWLKNTSGQGQRTLASALARIQELNATSYLGYTDWRLPNSEEMASLLDHSNSYPALPTNHPFTNIKNDYWTSTAYSETKQLRLQMRMGDFYAEAATEYNYVWPCRGGAREYYLLDAVTVLKILSRQEAPLSNRIKDVNNNGDIDLAEAIYILQSLMDLR